MRGNAAPLFAVIMAFGATGALAAEHRIQISHLELAPIEAAVREGDTLTFVNRSEITHNLYITYADATIVNLDTQVPGVTKSVVLEQSGLTTVRCWIHPVIRMELEVTPAAATNE